MQRIVVDFFRFALGLLFTAAVIVPGASALAADTAKPANIVLILADDMRWDAMSCAGSTILKTPNLDRLAAGGTRFTNAFATTAICCTSRASILSGQYARRHGVHNFKTRLPDLRATYPVMLHEAGYYSGFIGKWGVAANDREYFKMAAAAMDFWAGDLGQTSYWHEADCNYVTNNGTTERTNFFCSCPEDAQAAQGVAKGGGPHASLKHPVQAETQFIPGKIHSFFEQRDPNKPFCLSISTKAPHGPWGGYASRFAADFKGVMVPRRPSVSRAEAMREPEFLRQSLGSDRGLKWASDEQNVKRSEMIHDQLRLTEGLDYTAGEVWRELEERGLAGNTVIFFLGDNGYFYGEHGFSGKWLMYEESLRIPMIVCDPRLPASQRGKVSEEMTLNIDMAPTILALAGQPIPAGMQGQNLLPLLQDPKRPFRDEFFYEHLYRHGNEARIEPSEGVRTRDLKYIIYVDQTGPDREQLFDLRVDHYEMKNLIDEPEYARGLAKLRQRHQQLAATLK